MIHNIPQPVLEEEFTKLVEQDSNMILRKGFSIHAVRQGENEVVATVKEARSGNFHDIIARHLIACDGHKSKVREILNIPSEGEASNQVMMTIHFNANLRPVVGERVGMLFWIMDPLAVGVIIGYDLSGTQVHISQMDISKRPLEWWTEEMCRAIIRTAIGQDVPFDILSFRPWIFRRQIATTFQKGNVFLAGDAAHSFPPTGGLGLNCGLADVHNLAYKVALVHQNAAGPSILSTYTSERRSIADVYSKQSVKNGKQILALVQSLNTEGVEDITQARQNLTEALKNPKQRQKVDQEIEGQKEHFDNSKRLLMPHITVQFSRGARVPHAWISFTGSNRQGASKLRQKPIDVSYVTELTAVQVNRCQWSTLDLCNPNAFTLILGEQESRENPRTSKVQTRFQTINIQLNVWRLGIDFDVVDQPWFASEIHRGGLLVRPDQHIIMRISHSTSRDKIISFLDSHIGI
ncbi:Monooxygenase FAD-binding [Penicillium canariense]|uniref:Monooxygenase FAD-binding n=1 Tax=Penicillium canariense TaxID=189055 RepID=A0A9W9IHR6_9EURO|nr:Monooxygenase FAD-binding [Penicillium canariense]KAJ5176622.1 Monooxygenase FAD-binding [Penicillium canariense]